MGSTCYCSARCVKNIATASYCQQSLICFFGSSDTVVSCSCCQHCSLCHVHSVHTKSNSACHHWATTGELMLTSTVLRTAWAGSSISAAATAAATAICQQLQPWASPLRALSTTDQPPPQQHVGSNVSSSSTGSSSSLQDNEDVIDFGG